MSFFVTLLIYAVLFVLSDLLSPKPELENAKPAGIGDFSFPTATEQRKVPLLWGTVRIAGPNVVWWGDLQQEAIEEEVKTGLFSSETVTRGFRYHLGIQQALCEGGELPVDELVGVWIEEDQVLSDTGIRAPNISAAGTLYAEGDILDVVGGVGTAARVKVKKTSLIGRIESIKLKSPGNYTTFPGSPASLSGGSGSGASITFESGSVVHEGTFTIDEPDLFGGEEFGSGGVEGRLQFWAGTQLQNVSGYLSQHQKFPPVTGDTPAYRGYCYTAPHTKRVYLGNSTSIKPWKWEVRRTPNPLGLTGGKHRVNTYDANIMNVVFEAMTNTDWGQGIPAADIDSTSFTTVATTLFDEGNGFSMIVDREEDVGDLIRRLEQQADMVIFQNPFTGKWQAKLARDDYDIDLVPQLTVDNVKEVTSYTQSTWEDTKNQVTTPFNQRNDSYKGSYGFAQDGANIRVVGKKTPTEVRHPGVKDAALANALAWRALRTLSQPLIAMTAITDRSLFGVLPGDVLAFTDPDYNAVKLPVRVQAIDYGELLDGEIRMQLVQDVFRASAGSFGDPPGSGWDPPADDLVPFPSDEQLAIEAPRGLNLRDPLTTDPNVAKVFASARRQGVEVTYRLRERHATPPTAPSGAFTVFGQTFQFAFIGELQSQIDDADVYPRATPIVVVPAPDTQGDILNAFPVVNNIPELGTELLSLIFVGDSSGGEFMLVTGASPNGGNVDLDGVYRSILDTGQRVHASGTAVWLLFAGSGMGDDAFVHGDTVDVKLTPRSTSDEVAEADAATIQVQLDSRSLRPYCPSEFDLNGTRLDKTNVDLDGSGSGEDVGVLFENINRRDFRTTDEILALTNDAATLFADYPAEHSSAHSLVAKNGSTDLHVEDIGTAVTGTLRQLDILQGLDEVSLPSSLTFAVRARHTFMSTAYDNLADCQVVSTIASPLVGTHAFGALDTNDVSNSSTPVYEVQAGDENTDHDFTLSTAFTAGDVEYRLDGGAWLQLIAAGMTTGSIPNASLSVGTDIEIRHLSSDSGAQKLLTMTVGASTRGYAVLFT